MVEIDKMVVDVCREYLPQTASELNSPRLNLLIDDGVRFVKETKEKFDIILVDSTDPIGPAKPLFGEEFYRGIFKLLSDDGMVVSQGESPFYEEGMQESLLKVLGSIFPLVTIYNYTNLTYPGGLWSFTYASKGLDPLENYNSERVGSSGIEFKYYNPEIHRSAFALPEFMKKNVKGLTSRG